jgi:hypothetical protein
MNTLHRSDHISNIEVDTVDVVQPPHSAARCDVADQCCRIGPNVHEGTAPHHPIISRRRLDVEDPSDPHHVTVAPNVSRRPRFYLRLAIQTPHNAGVTDLNGRGRAGSPGKSTTIPFSDDGRHHHCVLDDPNLEHGMLWIHVHNTTRPSACTT